MIVRSRAGTTYIFRKDKRFWVLLNTASTEYNDYEKEYNSYQHLLSPLILSFWSEE